MQFCSEIKHSSCSLEKGWKTLCTIYPRELCFTVMVIVGQKEKDAVEKILPECMPELQMIYKQTEERNGQRWLMADLEDEDSLYHDLFRLIRIRSPLKYLQALSCHVTRNSACYYILSFPFMMLPCGISHSLILPCYRPCLFMIPSPSGYGPVCTPMVAPIWKIGISSTFCPLLSINAVSSF